jgi:hypothetical protein
MVLLILVTLIFIVVSLILIFATYRTVKTQTSSNSKIFLNGKVPNNLPDGLYKGKVTGLETSWQGKKFNSKENSGINVFKNDEKLSDKYPFKLYKANGLQDNIEVIKIDYNLPENPLWLRFIVDEIVETENNKYLGKLHIKLASGLVASLGYFSLEKE